MNARRRSGSVAIRGFHRRFESRARLRYRRDWKAEKKSGTRIRRTQGAMPMLIRQRAFAVFIAVVVCLVSGQADAAPTRLRLANGRPVPSAMGTSHAALIIRHSAALGSLERRAPAATISSVPLVPQHPVMHAVTMLLPRLGLATLLEPFGAASCTVPRSTTLLAVLPTTPFVPIGCDRAATDLDDTRLTSLTAGHNKKALYGPDFASHENVEP
jgi:hypothetical protein